MKFPRRAFLKIAAGAGAMTAAGSLATPPISQRTGARTLRLVPRSDLANFDPVWSTTGVAQRRAHSMQLYEANSQYCDCPGAAGWRNLCRFSLKPFAGRVTGPFSLTSAAHSLPPMQRFCKEGRLSCATSSQS
jgi:anaerobic selenocysteine-containing dehydrogenase